MEEKDALEFDLDDILKEFGENYSVSEEELTLAETEPEADHMLLPEEPAAEQPEETPAGPAMPDVDPGFAAGDTVRLDTTAILKGVATGAVQMNDEIAFSDATIRLDPEQVQSELGITHDGWEPEYEEPIAEYIPPRPILIHPRSRLKELKAKLVEGPEKQYYTLTEKGMGRLQAAMFLSLLVVALSIGATAMQALGMVQENRLRLMIFGQFLAMLVSALLGSFQLIEGAADILHKKFSLNSLLLFTFLACCADGILCFSQLRIPCCAAFSLEVTMSLWQEYQKRNTQTGQMDTLRKATNLYGICPVDFYHDGTTGLLKKDGEVEDFMDHYQTVSGPEKVLNVYALVALGVSIAIGFTGAILHDMAVGIQVLSVSLLASMPATAFISISRPEAVLERRLHAMGTVLCGWPGINALSGKRFIALDHQDLFPDGSVKLNGMKFFGSYEPDHVIACCTALIAVENNGLAPLFEHLLSSRNGRHYDVSEVEYCSGGLSGKAGGHVVLAGTLACLREQGVEIPDNARVNQAVYVALDGLLAGLFAMTYDKDPSSAAGMATLCGYRGLRPVLMTGDFMLTDTFLRKRFGVKTKRILFPDAQLRQQLSTKAPAGETPCGAMTTRQGLASIAFAVTGARSLKSAATAGVALHMTGGILGLVMMGILTVLGATEYLTPVSMFLYHMIWMFPALLITEWTRSI